jgi:hypothetical protein
MSDVLLDSNVLLRLLAATYAKHLVAADAVANAIDAGHGLLIAPQVVAIEAGVPIPNDSYRTADGSRDPPRLPVSRASGAAGDWVGRIKTQWEGSRWEGRRRKNRLVLSDQPVVSVSNPGAGEEIRTLDVHLGKVALYR